MLFGETCKLLKRWSGRRGSNPRRPAWEAGILPLNYSRLPLPTAIQTVFQSFRMQPLSTRRKLAFQPRVYDNSKIPYGVHLVGVGTTPRTCTEQKIRSSSSPSKTFRFRVGVESNRPSQTFSFSKVHTAGPTDSSLQH